MGLVLYQMKTLFVTCYIFFFFLTLNGFQHRSEWKFVFSSKVTPSSVWTEKLVMAWCQPPDKASFSSMTNNTKPLTSMLQKDSNTSLFSFGSREVEQCPAIGIADLRRVSLLQHSPDSVHITCCHCSLDLQLLMKLRVPPAVMVQHPVTIKIKRSHIPFMWQIWPIFFMNQYQLNNLDQNIILSWLYFEHPSLLVSFVPHMKHVRLPGALLSDSVFQLSLEKGSGQTFRLQLKWQMSPTAGYILCDSVSNLIKWKYTWLFSGKCAF